MDELPDGLRERQEELVPRGEDHLLGEAGREEEPVGEAADLVVHLELRRLGRPERAGDLEAVVEARGAAHLHVEPRDRHAPAGRERLGGGEAGGAAEAVAGELAVEDVVAVPDDAVGVDLREADVELDAEGAGRRVAHGAVKTTAIWFPPAPREFTRTAPSDGSSRRARAVRAELAGFVDVWPFRNSPADPLGLTQRPGHSPLPESCRPFAPRR